MAAFGRGTTRRVLDIVVRGGDRLSLFGRVVLQGLDALFPKRPRKSALCMMKSRDSDRLSRGRFHLGAQRSEQTKRRNAATNESVSGV